MKHALALGVVGVFLSTIGAGRMWDAGPAWYALTVIANALPSAWAGGRLYAGNARAGLRDPGPRKP